MRGMKGALHTRSRKNKSSKQERPGKKVPQKRESVIEGNKSLQLLAHLTLILFWDQLLNILNEAF